MNRIAAPPSIATKRLILRRPALDDAAAVFAYAGDAEVTRFMSWSRHAGLEETRRFLEFALASWDRDGIGVYLVERDGTVIGSTGLNPDNHRGAATGYILVRPAWGYGYATEACRAMIELGRTLGYARIEAHCHVDHAASARVLERSGMRFEGILRRKILLPNLSPEPQDVRSYAWTPSADVNSPSSWVVEQLGRDAFDRLTTGLSGSELQSLLLAVMHARAGARTPFEVLRQYEQDRFCRPAPVDARASNAIDREFFAAAQSFEAIELSPVAPLAACSAVAPTDQNRVVSALRGTEVAADPTNVLALECALRLRANDPSRAQPPSVHLATSQRVVRAQPVPPKAGYAPHFRMFVLASAGREGENHSFTVETLADHIRTLLQGLERLERCGHPLGARRVEIRATAERAELGDRVARAIGTLAVRSRLEHPYYSGGLRYTLWVAASDGEEVPLGDGGAFDWLTRLSSNRRAVFIASGIGTQLVGVRFPAGSLPPSAR